MPLEKISLLYATPLAFPTTLTLGRRWRFLDLEQLNRTFSSISCSLHEPRGKMANQFLFYFTSIACSSPFLPLWTSNGIGFGNSWAVVDRISIRTLPFNSGNWSTTSVLSRLVICFGSCLANAPKLDGLPVGDDLWLCRTSSPNVRWSRWIWSELIYFIHRPTSLLICSISPPARLQTNYTHTHRETVLSLGTAFC